MLANLQLIRQEEDILLNSKCETPLTNYLLFNTKYKDAMRKTMLKTNTPLVNKWILTAKEKIKWSAYIRIFNLENPNWFLRENTTNLYLAARYGWLDIIKNAVDKNQKLDTIMINAWSKDFKLLVQDSWVLVEASKSGNLELVKYLIDKGANLNTRIKSAMQAAITYRHYNIFKYLVELNIIPLTNYYLEWAANYNSLDIVKYLIEVHDITDVEGEALILASADGQLDIVKYLIGHNFLYAKEVNNDYVLMQDNQAVKSAIMHGNLEVVKYLVEGRHITKDGSVIFFKGANVSAEDNIGLINASHFDHLNMIKYLVENNNELGGEVDVTAQNNLALIYAARNGNTAIVKYLVEGRYITKDGSVGTFKRADITAQNNLPLIWAARAGRLDIVKYLVGESHTDDDGNIKVVDITAQNNLALSEAKRNDHNDIVEYIISRQDI